MIHTCVYALIFILIRIMYHKSNIDVNSLLVAIICTICTHYFVWNYNIFEMYDMISYPVYVYEIPTMLYGYSIYEITKAIYYKEIDFFIHGLSIFIMSTHLNYINSLHFLFPIYITETSNLFLSVRKKHILCDILFVVTFIIYKLIIVPYFLFYSIIDVRNPLRYHILIYALPFTILNMYWSFIIFKIIKKKMCVYK